jgi:hypothetical protein
MGRLMDPTPLPARLAVYVAECCPTPQRAIAKGHGWPVLQATTVPVEPECFPGRLALAVAIPQAHTFCLAAGVSAHDDEDALARFRQAGFEGHAVDPAIDIPFTLETAALPWRQCVVPGLLQPADRRRGEVRGLWPPQGLSGLGTIPCRDAFEGPPGPQGVEACRAAEIRGPECRVQAHPAATTVPHSRPRDPHRSTPGVHLTRGPRAIPDPCLAALGITSVSILGSSPSDFGLKRLRQESWRSLASEVRSRVLRRELWMRKGNRRLCLHGVSTVLSQFPFAVI